MQAAVRRLASAVIFACVVAAAGSGRATDQGQYADVPADVRAWFKSVHSRKGVPCCDIADGHRTTWRGGKDGGYEVPIPGSSPGTVEWVPVPEEAVVYDAGNPVGEAVVWYSRYSGAVFIRCFVPGGGV